MIRDVILDTLSNEFLTPLDDGAILPEIAGRIVVSTDTYVVTPLFFPGGDIGRLAVHGTVNDLVSCGAEPLFLTLGLVIEEGLPIETLRRVLIGIRDAAAETRVKVVTGDTKVVPRGAADGIFANTSGLGRLWSGVNLGMNRIRPDDAIIVTGTIADHGIAVLGARESLDFGRQILSDSAALGDLIKRVHEAGHDIHFMRDPTRGGVSAVLHEVAEATRLSMIVEERSVPIAPAVRGACEILGLDPLHVANEGKMLLFTARDDEKGVLDALGLHPLGVEARVIGRVSEESPGRVLIRTTLGRLRILEEPAGSPLPRIC